VESGHTSALPTRQSLPHFSEPFSVAPGIEQVSKLPLTASALSPVSTLAARTDFVDGNAAYQRGSRLRTFAK
jgi:hypothetical protein